MQLMLTTRQWMVISRALLQAGLPSEVRNEQFLHLVLLGTSAAKEAADAFRRCDELEWFEGLPFTPLPKVREPLALARSECDPNDHASLYKRVLQRFRNNAGFHWSRELLGRGLRNVAELDLKVAHGGTTNFDTAIPLAQVLASEVLASQGAPTTKIPDLFPRVVALQDSLRHIADSTVALTIRASLNQNP